MIVDCFRNKEIERQVNLALKELHDVLILKAKIPLKRSPKELDRFIEKNTKKFEKMYAGFWKRQKELISKKAVRDSMGSYMLTVELQDDLHEGLRAFVNNEFNPVYQGLINDAGKEIAQKIIRAVKKPMGFNIISDRIVNLVRANAFAKITQMSTAQVESVRLALMNGLDKGWGIMKIQSSMQGSVPLTKRLTEAVFNYRDRLSLADMSPKMIDYKTELYRKKLLKVRRKLISRTEIQRGYNSGNMEGVQQAIDGGIIKEARKRRHVIMDERTQHADFDQEEAPINEPYPNSGEMYSGENSFNCRCTDEYIMEV